jgi:hypothetical protein
MVTLDYFGRNEGVVIDIYHTGPSDKLRVHGFVKGYRSIEHRQPSPGPCVSVLERVLINPLLAFVRKVPRVIRIPLFFVVLIPFVPLLMLLLASDLVIGWLRPIPSAFRLTGASG